MTNISSLRANPQGYVYLVHALQTDRYKIGKTIDLKKRLFQLKRQSPYPMKIVQAFETSAPEKDEACLHKAFEKYRVYGEWFAFDDSFYRNVVELSFWSEHEQNETLELAKALAKSRGFFWDKLNEPSKCIYVNEAESYRGYSVYSSDAHIKAFLS